MISSCNGTKQCVAPDLNIPDSFSIASPDSASVGDMTWMQYYGDPLLCQLIGKALANNHDVRIAAERIVEMDKLFGAAKTAMLPELSARIYGNRETYDYSGKSAVIDPEYGAKLSLTWEADLWKKLSWGKKKGEAQYLASVEDKRAMDILVVSRVAETYFTLLALDSELDIVKRTLATREEGLKQAKLRFEGGLTSEMVYRQAEVERTTTASLIPALEEEIVLTENALHLLLGEYPGEPIARPEIVLSEVVVKEPKVGVPSELLQRRPDLRAAEMKLKSAMADVGIRYAERFPSFTIGLTGGLENDKLEKFLQTPFSFVVGSLTAPIFDFGKRKKNYEAAIAKYNQEKIAYEKAVMNAFKEVNDAIIAYRAARATAQLKTELRDAAMKYVELARLQYIGGTSLYIDVLDAQRRYFDAQIALSNAVKSEYLALVDLYKSLGGGWSVTPYQSSSDGGVESIDKTEL
ncbi:MAG: TolC family protein [Paramuribaculum sp.]|nr:TolC family protein [Paramuribaculum sp.]